MSINESTLPSQLTPTKKTPWLVIVLVILLLGVTGAFVYKYYQLKQQPPQTQSTSSIIPPREPSPIKGDALLKPGSLENVTLWVDFGDGKRYESISDITYSEQKTPMGFLKANAQGIKREMGFSEFSVKELIKADTDDLTQAIGNYSNSDLFAWGCYINGRLCVSSLENIQSNDTVEWKYEAKQ